MLLGCPESTFIAAHELCKAFLHSVEVACMGADARGHAGIASAASMMRAGWPTRWRLSRWWTLASTGALGSRCLLPWCRQASLALPLARPSLLMLPCICLDVQDSRGREVSLEPLSRRISVHAHVIWAMPCLPQL